MAKQGHGRVFKWRHLRNLRALDRELGPASYSTKSLFRDDQRMVLRHILDSTLEEAEAAFRQIHEHHAALIQFLSDLGVPLPKPMATAAEFALNGLLRGKSRRNLWTSNVCTA